MSLRHIPPSLLDDLPTMASVSDIPTSAALDIRISINRRIGSSRHQDSAASMGTFVVAPNKGLYDHVLLITAPWVPPQAWLDEVHARHPGLRVIFHQLGYGETLARQSLAEEDWTAVTILLTGGFGLPLPEQMPKLQYVQLISAGANMVLKQPLFADTNIVFATANGVHG